jgi:hypothetical protein
MNILQTEEDIFGKVGVIVMAKKIETSKYTEDWIPVKGIQNGMIILDNNYYVTGIKVEPKKYFYFGLSNTK